MSNPIDAGASGQTQRRLLILGGIVLVAAVIVVVAIILSSGGGDKKKADGDGGGSGLANVAEVQKMYAGIPQSGITLGDPKAKATIVVFADPQCPYCRDFELTEFPGVVKNLVRTGKAKVQLRIRAFIGDDSVKAAGALYAAALQNKMYQASGILYNNQGEENSGWFTAEIEKQILTAAGVDVARALKDASGDQAQQLLGATETLASRYGSQSTPDVYVGTSENDGKKTGATEADITAAVGKIAG